MATTRVVAGDKEVITNTETTVTSALVSHVRIFLPAIGDGSGATVAAGASITCSHTVNAGSLTVLDNQGRRVLVLDGGSKVQLIAQGDATDNLWVVSSEIANDLPARALAVNGTLLPALYGELINTKVIDIASLGAGASGLNSIVVTGAAMGDAVSVTSSIDMINIVASAYVNSPNNVRLVFFNPTTGTINLGSATYTARVTPQAGILPAGAGLAVAGWQRISLPDGTVGLVPFWDEIA